LAHQHCSPPATGYLERIELESGRLNELIGELLTLTRLESGSEHLERKPVDLCPFMEKLAQDAGFEAQNRGRSVVITTCDPLTIVGDAEMLRRALENVIRNALRYSPEGSTVEIALRRVHDGMGSCAVISVRDHGPGVPEGALADLFLPFYRVADARDRQSGGTGIGLAITERAVRLHGGSVRAINAEGGGLLVELLIPAETTMHGSSAADVEGEP
jgi:two-component system sensor histidine kinase CpxA